MSTDAATKQLANILDATGKALSEHVAEIREADLQKHGEILAFFKSQHGLGHGNANLLAHEVRRVIEERNDTPDDLLADQYSGAKAALLPLFSEVSAMCEALGNDVTKVAQKTGVAFRRNKLFALVQAPSAKRLQIGLNLPNGFSHSSVKSMTGMCSHKMSLTSVAEIDDQIAGILREAYENC